MHSEIAILAGLCLTGLTLAIPESYPVYLVSEHRNDRKSTQSQEHNISSNDISYEYQIVPSSEYAVTEHNSETSLMDLILSPITALSALCSTALSVVSWILKNGSLVVLGMAIVIGFCALTPYCTLIIEQTFARELRSSASYIPFLDEVESLLIDAYHKYHAIQNVY